jgi:hypothetical protein
VIQSENPITRFWYLSIVLLLAVLVGLTWANYRFAVENPGGNDFLVHWVGTRALLVDGVSPYSDAVALEIQELAYGRPAQPGEHELRPAYPLYSAILFLPFALTSNFTLARAFWMTTLEAGLVLLAIFSLRVTRWRPGMWFLVVYLLFTIFWYHSVRAVINGNAVILVALLVVGSLEALRTGRDELAGILLALATLKPHLVLVIGLFLVIWTLSLRRWRLLFWFLVVVLLLSVVMAFFIPDWPLQNLREILRYSSYNPPGTPAAVLATWLPATGRQIGWAISALIGLILIIEWLAARRKEFRWFLWTACLTITASQWIGVQTDPGNFVMLFTPVVLILAVLEERFTRRGRILNSFLMSVLLVGPWVLFYWTVEVAFGQPQQHPGLLFPLPLFLIIILYWVRWWAIRPQRLLVETLRDYEELG